jgi:hypothetical protein
VEGQRQCAPLLSGTWPIEFSADALSGAKVDALVAAGLVRRVALPDTGDRPRVRIEPTEAGKRDLWLRRLDPTSPAEPLDHQYPPGDPPSTLARLARRTQDRCARGQDWFHAPG